MRILFYCFLWCLCLFPKVALSEEAVVLPEDLNFPESEMSILNAHGELHRFQIQIALTPRQQYYGIMFRPYLDPQYGMLYLYPEPRKVEFWTKNTLVPIDMIFFDAKGCVVEVQENIPADSTETRSATLKVRGVFEVAAGTVQRLGLGVGDQMMQSVFGVSPVEECPNRQKES